MPSPPTPEGSSGRRAASVPDAIRRSIGFSPATRTSSASSPSPATGSSSSPTSGVPPYSRRMAARMPPRYLLAALVALLAAAPPAAASRESRAWQRILRAHHVEGRSADVYMLPGNNSHRLVSVVLGVRGTAPEPVHFSDSLYGA